MKMETIGQSGIEIEAVTVAQMLWSNGIQAEVIPNETGDVWLLNIPVKKLDAAKLFINNWFHERNEA